MYAEIGGRNLFSYVKNRLPLSQQKNEILFTNTSSPTETICGGVISRG